MDYLAHHGTKGMKWGIRRYQNEDGSLTDAGKKRYGYYEDAGSRAYERKHRKAYNDVRKQYDKVDSAARKARVRARQNPKREHAADVMEAARSLEKQAMNKTLSQLKMGKKEIAYRETGYNYSKHLQGSFGGQLLANAIAGPLGSGAYVGYRALNTEGRRLGKEYNKAAKEYKRSNK